MVWDSYNFSFDNSKEQLAVGNPVELSGFASENAKFPSGDASKKEEERDAENAKPPGRTFIVEPIILMMYLFHFLSFTVSSQYTYYAIGEKYNLSGVMAAAGSGDNGSSKDVCGDGEDSGDHTNNTAYELQQKVQAENAMFNFYMGLISDIPGFFIILFYGSLIDKLGRKPGIIIPIVGTILRGLLFIIQMVFGLPVEILLITGLTDAMTGGMSIFFASCYAYMADTIPRDKRARRLSIADIVYGMSLAILKFFSGYIIQAYGYLVPFLFTVPGLCLNLFYVIFFVPESRQTGAKKTSVTPRYVYQSFRVLTKKRPNNGRTLLMIFVVMRVSHSFASGAMMLDTMYKLNSPFCWAPTQMGSNSSYSSIVMNLVQILSATCLLRYLGALRLIMVAMFSNMGDFIITGLATQSWMLWLAPTVGSLVGIISPLLRTIMMTCVDKGEQGSLSASLSAVLSITGLLSSSFFNLVYAETLYVFKGTVFLISAGLLCISIVLVWVYKIISEREEKSTEVEVAIVDVETKEADKKEFNESVNPAAT